MIQHLVACRAALARTAHCAPWTAFRRSLVVGFVATLATTGQAQTTIPANAQQSCLTDAIVKSWFRGGVVVPNGFVTPPNSAAFPAPANLYDFYSWSERMFLWLTSPAYGSGGRVFDSPLFYDVSDSVSGVRTLVPIQPGIPHNLALRAAKRAPSTVKMRKLLTTGKPTEIEQGQAGGGDVLTTQSGHLIYYAIQVNDVYAYFLTGQKDNAFTPAITTFPTTPAQLQQIEQYAMQHGHSLAVDGQTLAIELKSSWVEIDAIPVAERSQYVTMRAVIPTYTKTSSTLWTLNPPAQNKEAELALVGLHIVGTVLGHPEFIWATFEQVNNSPGGSYTYTTSNGQTATVNQSTAGNWLFCAANAAAASLNVSRMQVDQSNSSGNIVAIPEPTPPPPPPYPTAIGPSNTLRTAPWGNGPGSNPAIVGNNTEIIAANHAVMTTLINGDARKNYFLVGAAWTINGVIPLNGATPDFIGSMVLANSTMESYFQFPTQAPSSPPVPPVPPSTAPAQNCFLCHQGGANSFAPFGLSHIYSQIKPLF